MTGETHETELTAENFPIHFAVAKEFEGTVHLFEQYPAQGPFIMVPGPHAGTRFFLHSAVDGIVVCWFDEDLHKYSSPFVSSIFAPTDLEMAIEAFRDLLAGNGTAEPYNDGKASAVMSLAASLASYVTADDAELPRDEFLRTVADRIYDDVPGSTLERDHNRELAAALEHAANFIAAMQRTGVPAGPVAVPSTINDALARLTTTHEQRRRESAALQAGLRLLRDRYRARARQYQGDSGKEVFVANTSAEQEAAALLTRGDTTEPLSPAEIVSLSASLGE